MSARTGGAGADGAGADGRAPAPGCAALFWNFALVGLCGFGGVLAWARYRMVDRCGWLTDREFTDLLALGQLLPGPNIANVAVIYGRRRRGAAGALCALVGLYAGPTVVTVALGLLYARWSGSAFVQQVFGAVVPVAAGLTLGTALRLGAGLPRTLDSLVVVLSTFVAMVLLAWPLWAVLLLVAPASVALAWHRSCGGAGGAGAEPEPRP